ncbi:MAG: VOC family protein [Cyclobacteriaceae bacterium]|jgi:catechol 2,3-dioxygenase-like lactoylglutathione lyase family enzyme|nr:VOC family protein [Cyclobacteriaceae bacterium]
MEFIKIKETCLYVRDLVRAREFYEQKLGLTLISYLEGKHAFFKAGSSMLLLFNPDDSATKKSPPAHFGEGKQHFAFEVPADRYAEAKGSIEAKNIVITDEVTWSGGMKSFYFEDPEGNVLEILPDQGIWPE